MKKLPDKPSELIELALADLEKVEKLPEVYEVFMGFWHTREVGPLCQVCLAGTVLAQTLKRDPSETISLSKKAADCGIDQDTWRKLRSLDDFRCGRVGEGLYELGLISRDECETRNEDELDDGERIDEDLYSEDPAAFKVELRTVADRLRREGY